MNNELILPHGLVSPTANDLHSFELIIMGVIISMAFGYLCFRLFRQSNQPRLSKYKQSILDRVDAILDIDESSVLSQRQAYLLWRLIRKTGCYYFGQGTLNSSLDEAISVYVRTSDVAVTERLHTLFIQLSQSVYDPNLRIEKSQVKSLLSSWLQDKQALKMEVIK